MSACPAAGLPVITCGERHLEEIRAIYNEAIEKTTAVYEQTPRTASMMADWFAAKQQAGLPVLGVERDGKLAGFATWGTFRPYSAYAQTAEHSIYVASNWRRQGIGRQLLSRVIEEATMRGLHLLVAGIDATNTPSIDLHRQAGFCHAGTIREAGFKFGRWLDLDFWQRVLDGSPVSSC
jgi:L-amino acid N-acyltransferase YncA